MGWQMVDEGWGRRAADFASLSEPTACREYVTVHHRLGIGDGDRVLDVACGAGLAIELAAARGAECAGIDASTRLIDVARHRCPGADLRVGDMGDLPWDDESFDAVTSFRGIWGTTPEAVDEARRVLRPGGRIALTCWGNVGRSPGAWMFSPLRFAGEEKLANQAAMVSLGRPGVGETFLADRGFDAVERAETTAVFEYADPEIYARGLAATGPAYEAIQEIGEDDFLRRAAATAQAHTQDGLPLRGEVPLFCFIGTKP